MRILIAQGMNTEQICRHLRADSLGYLSQEGLRRCQGADQGRYYEACFSGDYPIAPLQPDDPEAQFPLFQVDGPAN